MKVLTNLDLQKNSLIAARIENSSSVPLNPVEGQIYYDTTEHTVKQYNGTAWVTMGSSYTLPIASANALGGIKVGTNLTIDSNGVLSADQGIIVFQTSYNATTNKAATMADVAAAVSALGTVFDLKGTKATYAEIEAIVDPSAGDVWICTADNSEYVYVSGDPSGSWEKLGPAIDLSGYLQISNLANNVTGESTTTAPTQKAVHDALANLPTGGDEVFKGTGAIAVASSSCTITLSSATTPDIISVRSYVAESGAKIEVLTDVSYNATTKVVTITSSGHTSEVTCEVYYKES